MNKSRSMKDLQVFQMVCIVIFNFGYRLGQTFDNLFALVFCTGFMENAPIGIKH
jgi:hypothetical protein